MTTQEQLQAAVERATRYSLEEYKIGSKENYTKFQLIILTELQPIFDALVNEKQDAETQSQIADVFFEATKLELDKANERVKELETLLVKQLLEENATREKVLDDIVSLRAERDHLKQQLEEANKALKYYQTRYPVLPNFLDPLEQPFVNDPPQQNKIGGDVK